MTLPNEQKRSLKRTRDFLRAILPMRLTDFRKMGKDGFEEWRMQAYSCLRHYPYDCHLDARWSDDVCEHGDMRRWCRKCEESTERDAV